MGPGYPFTSERLAMTPGMIAAVRAETRVAPYLVGLGVLAVPTALIGYLAHAVVGAAVVYLGVVLLFAAVYLLWTRPHALRDLRDGTFVRSRGRFGIARYNESTDSIQAPDGTWLTVDLDVVKAVMGLERSSGEIDYAPLSEVIFEIRDSSGATVWRNRRL